VTMRRVRLGGWLVCLAASACGGAEGGATGAPAVRDSAGVRIVDHTGEAAEWSLGAPTLDLGEAEREGPEQFYRVAGATLLRDGSVLAVADGGSGEIRLFDAASGVHLETWGGRGEGPGEFMAPGRLQRLSGDSLAVWDFRAEQLTILDPSGSFVRRIGTPQVPNAELVTVLEDGSALLTSRLLRVTRTFEMTDLHLLHVGVDGEALDTVETLPYTRYGQIGEEGAYLLASPHLEATTYVAGDVGGYWVAGGREAEVRRHAPTGEPAAIARWPEGDRRVPDGVAEAALRERLEDAPEDRQAAIRRQEADRPVADRTPTSGWATPGVDGSLWVEVFEWPDAEGTSWRVVAPDGRILGRVRTPEFPDRFIPLHVGPETVVAVHRDELGVEYVRVHPVLSEGGSAP